MSNLENNKNEQWKLLVFILKEIAIQKNISQIQIAEATGLARPTISRFFLAKYKPNLDLFLEIAKAIKVNFFFEDQDSKSDLNEAFEKAMENLGRRPNKLPKN